MSASRVVWARYQGLVDFIGFHPLDKAIHAKIWLIISCDFDSKLHKTFPVINIDGYWCETHEDIPITLAKHISWKGPTCKARVQYTSLGWGSFPKVWPWHLHRHSICHVWAQTHSLTSDKHLGCYSPPPLKESRPEIRCKRLLREEKHVNQFPTSVIAVCYLTSEYQRG